MTPIIAYNSSGHVRVKFILMYLRCALICVAGAQVSVRASVCPSIRICPSFDIHSHPLRLIWIQLNLVMTENRLFAYAKTKTQIRCAVCAADLHLCFRYTVQFLYFLNPKFQDSSHLLWLYSTVCVGPGRKPR